MLAAINAIKKKNLLAEKKQCTSARKAVKVRKETPETRLRNEKILELIKTTSAVNIAKDLGISLSTVYHVCKGKLPEKGIALMDDKEFTAKVFKLSSNHKQAEIAALVGCCQSTVCKILSEVKP